ncbi:hypothetical protein [Methylobacillus flagellatus]|uniref:hypothetical protein n=1 Tax=Methylobacillus flagellatus TaxID=405 RepID=UPI0010F62887|nr:hypothetical protein [Methylobacillus flagellatus]
MSAILARDPCAYARVATRAVASIFRRALALSTSRVVTLLSALLCLQLAACGEFSYKRGASAGDLQQAKNRCESQYKQSATQAAEVERCLAAEGWVVKDFDKDDPVLSVMFTDNQRAPGPVTSYERREANIPALPATNPASEPGDPAPSNPGKAATVAASATTLATPAATKAPATPTAPAAAPAPKDPLDIFLISSWWKVGGGPDALKADTDACVATLGEAHRPDRTTLKTTRGLLLCMRDRGWRALQAK